MVPYPISQCTVADSAAITRNNIGAFWPDSHFRLSWPHVTLDQLIEGKTKLAPIDLLDDDRTTKRHQKAIDPETGHLLGYARWKVPPTNATLPDGTLAWPDAVIPMVGQEEEAELRRIANSTSDNESTHADELEIPVRKIRNEILGMKSYMRLDYLAVHPDYQGKGVGTALVQSGMKEAAKMGLDIYIQAYPAGVGVYKRLGFRIENQLIQDISPYGGEGDYGVYFMTYEQNGRSE